MKKFMVEIKLHDLPFEKVGELAPPEDAIIKEMIDAGVIEKDYVRSDFRERISSSTPRTKLTRRNIPKRCRCFPI